ncbi:hypothetical protein [Shewanella zhangzhouensis]|uniref:hypothetical protein n=1 Tax=Shewanella zhangzhouensis TaxID=2864213 RepID=UPI001C6549F0|nr:hypothetical protein [Shewanella zhangzhouensis]QYK03784.1 hypothetical protein K0H63_11810 [Shewanella zhangzhouensis]
MTEFWQNLWGSIDWHFTFADGVAFALLLIWLWIIWPKDALNSLLADKERQIRALLSLSTVMGLWLFNAGVHGMLQLHFLGLVTLMLMFSWRLASVLALLPCAFYCLAVLKQPWLFGAYALMGVCLPLYLAFVIHNRGFYWLPNNVFVLIFVGGFFNAGVSQVSHEGLWSLWLWATEMQSSAVLWQDYLSLSVLMVFPEALLNGMAVTLLVVYRPQWLSDYSDRYYLWRK